MTSVGQRVYRVVVHVAQYRSRRQYRRERRRFVLFGGGALTVQKTSFAVYAFRRLEKHSLLAQKTAPCHLSLTRPTDAATTVRPTFYSTPTYRSGRRCFYYCPKYCERCDSTRSSISFSPRRQTGTPCVWRSLSSYFCAYENQTLRVKIARKRQETRSGIFT